MDKCRRKERKKFMKCSNRKHSREAFSNWLSCKISQAKIAPPELKGKTEDCAADNRTRNRNRVASSFLIKPKASGIARANAEPMLKIAM